VRTALVIPIPEAEPQIGALRLAHDPVAAEGVPAHVTVLFPFAQPADVDEAAIEAFVAQHRAFDFQLVAVRYFDDTITYLAPEPSAPFVALTRAAWARWPEFPPYGGAHRDIIPHVTVAHERLALDLTLPIACRAREVFLLEEGDVRWRLRRAFPLPT